MLSVGPRNLRRQALQDAQKMLAKRDVTLIGVLSESMETTGAALKLGLRVDLGVADMATHQVAPLPRKPPRIDPEERGTPGVLLKRTLRNGRMVHSDGHVVVLGDVNAGAVIVAEGDVIVWGRLRGVVHAGAGGDETAVVCALHLAPTQLRIAGYISISPEVRQSKPQPEKAMVRNGRIEAVAWDYRNMG
jgi:septum site-determining protein MinC